MAKNSHDQVLKLSDLLLKGSAANAPIESFEEDNILIKEGTSVEQIFLIEEGEVEVFIRDKKVSSFPAPAVVGEMSLLFGKSVACVKSRTRIFFRRVSYDALLDEEKRLLRELAELRNRSNMEQGRYNLR